MTKKVPSMIFLVGSSASLSSAISFQTLDTEDSLPSSLRGNIGQGFGLMNADVALANTTPMAPKRKISGGMGFRKLSSSFDLDHRDSMKNATFDILKSPGMIRKNSRPSLVDRFGCLAPVPTPFGSPGATQRSRKTVVSAGSSDTPLTVPRRKPSDISFSSPASSKILASPKMFSGTPNANFRDLLKAPGSQSAGRSPNRRSPLQAQLLRPIRM